MDMVIDIIKKKINMLLLFLLTAMPFIFWWGHDTLSYTLFVFSFFFSMIITVYVVLKSKNSKNVIKVSALSILWSGFWNPIILHAFVFGLQTEHKAVLLMYAIPVYCFLLLFVLFITSFTYADIQS